MTGSDQGCGGAGFMVCQTANERPRPAVGALKVREFFNRETGASMAGGLVAFNAFESAPFTLWYDEIIGVHETDGEFELEYDGRVYPMKPGDVAWVRRGTTLIYRSRGGTSTLFYAALPVDWSDLRPDA